MAVIKKAQANFDNGTDYDVLHYETQIKQVKKVNASGVVIGDLEAELTRIDSEIDQVDAKVVNADLDITNLENKVSVNTTLNTNVKTVIPAINELKGRVDTNATDIAEVDTDLQAFKGHNHDSVYLKLIGGNLTNTVSVSNDKSFAGKNTSGVSLNIGKINATNDVVVGDITAKTIIQAKSGDIKLSDGTSSYKIFHEGNDGSGSGLDADLVDGIEGSKLARNDATNYFSQSQVVNQGKHLYMDAPVGSNQAGSLIFRSDNGATQIAKLSPSVGGDLYVTAGSIQAHTFKATGELVSTYSHVMDVSAREVRQMWKNGSSDAGMGFYMNTGSNQVGLYDWEAGKALFTTNRTNQSVLFNNAIEIQGHKLSIQTTAPASPAVGDVWIDI